MKFAMSILVVVLVLGWQAAAMPKESIKPKLLYILLDGFRYDYVDDLDPSELPGFTELISNGVKARWVNPLWPTLSYPSWTTLSTGQYAETHSIVGNYFYDAEEKDEFSLFDNNSTGKAKWWKSEPIWTTATKAGMRVALYLWARCDVPIRGIIPEYCERFQKVPGPEIFRTNVDNALDKFEDGFDVVQVYTEHLDDVGHNIGPETDERRTATREIDQILLYLQDQLRLRGLDSQVNIVIVSDHGMINTAPGVVTRHELDDYLPVDAAIESIADKGTYINIKVGPESLQAVYDSVSQMSGVTAYKREDIPEELHLTGSKYMHDILLLTDTNTFVLASNREEQLPTRSDFVYYGAHGFAPTEEKMRSIFYAKGPAFKNNVELEPIDIVDIYQVLTAVLKLESQPHNGTWSHVEGAFASADSVVPRLTLLVVGVVVTMLKSAMM